MSEPLSQDPEQAADDADGASFVPPSTGATERVASSGSYKPIILVALAIIAFDQVTKVLVVRNMHQGQSIDLIGTWLKLTYTENPGMAFGIQFGPPALITIFSIVATVLIVMYLARVGRLYAPYRYSLALVLGGAFGNIIDRVLYGWLLYDEPLFLGRVVDFIHVNLWRGHVPEAVPFIGGSYMALFPIWNVADMAIVTGVAGILIFQRSFHRRLAELEVDGFGLSGRAEDEDAPPEDPANPSPSRDATS